MLTKSTHTPRESYGRKGPNQPLAWLDHALFLSCPKLLEIGISFKIGGGGRWPVPGDVQVLSVLKSAYWARFRQHS